LPVEFGNLALERSNVGALSREGFAKSISLASQLLARETRNFGSQECD
jgi:hypothetical protein